MACNLCGVPTAHHCPVALKLGVENPTKQQIDAYCKANDILTLVAPKQTV